MDDIIQQYLKPKDGEVNSSSSVPTTRQDDDIVKQYLKPKDAPARLYVGRPSPPISPFDKETSDELNAQPSKKGGDNPRDGIVSVPIKALEAGYDTVKSGALQAGQGLGEALSGKPASGLGKLGTGALTILGAPSEAVSSATADLTGSKDIGDRAGLISGIGLPVAKATKFGVSKVPGLSNLSSVPILNKLQNVNGAPRDKALNELVSQITSEGKDYQALVNVVDAMKKDSRVGPVDMSPTVLNTTQQLFTKSTPATKNYLFSTSKDRVSNLGNDITKAYDTIGGTPVNVIQKLNDLAAASKKVGNDLINPAVKDAGPVNIEKVVSHIDNVLKPGVMQKVTGESTLPFPKVKQALANVKSMIANKSEWLSSPQDLHNFQSALRKEAEARLSSADGSERQLGHALMHVRSKLVDAIDVASPKINGEGSYKPALSAYRDEKHIADAFGDAYNGVFTNSTKMENRPEFTKQWFDGLTTHEKEAAREGARLAIDSKMGASQNASLAGTNLGRSDFNKQKLEILFGKEETENLLRNLENTKSIKNTDQKIVEGSQTGMRMTTNKFTDMPEHNKKGGLENWALPVASEYAGQVLSGSPAIGGLLGGGVVAAKAIASKASHVIATKLAAEKHLQFSKMALPVEGPKRDQLIRELESFIPGPKQSLVTRIANRLPITP